MSKNILNAEERISSIGKERGRRKDDDALVISIYLCIIFQFLFKHFFFGHSKLKLRATTGAPCDTCQLLCGRVTESIALLMCCHAFSDLLLLLSCCALWLFCELVASQGPSTNNLSGPIFIDLYTNAIRPHSVSYPLDPGTQAACFASAGHFELASIITSELRDGLPY